MIIEKTIIDYLNRKLAVTAYAQRPETEPSSYVLVEKTGSSKANEIESATIAIQSYAKSMYTTAQINESVKSAMKEIEAEKDISGAKLMSDYNFTNQTAKRYRYQAVFYISHY